MTSPIDFTHPMTSDNYATAFVPAIIANQVAQAMWLDSVQTTYTAGLAQYMKRFNRTSLLFEEYSGSAWATLATNYAVINAVNTFAVNGTPIIINSANSISNKITLQDAGVTRGFLFAQATSMGFTNAANTTQTFQVDNSGNATLAGQSNATQFNGSGAGLTGTAASLTAGTASALTAGNRYTGVGFIGSGSNPPAGVSSFPYYSSGSYGGGVGMLDGTYAWGIYDVAGALVFGSGTGATGGLATQMRLSAAGALSLNGGITCGAIDAGGQISAGSGTVMAQYHYGNGLAYYGTTGAASMIFVTNNVVRGSIDTSANLVMNGNVTAYSDERKKKNWRGFDFDFIEFLCGIKSGVYDRTDMDLTQAGLSAQDVQKGVPDAVLTDKDGFLSLAYGQFAAVSVVELAHRIRQLEKRIAA